MRRISNQTKAVAEARCNLPHQRITVWTELLNRISAKSTFKNFATSSFRFAARARHLVLHTTLYCVCSNSSFANTSALPPPTPSSESLFPPAPPPSESSIPPPPDSQSTQAPQTTTADSPSAPFQTKTSEDSDLATVFEQSKLQDEPLVSASTVKSKSTSARLKTKFSNRRDSFGLFAAGKLGWAYRTLPQPVTDEPINIDPGQFMIAGFQLAWIPHLSRSEKMLIRIGLDYYSSLNLRLEERSPGGNSSRKPLRHQWLALSMAWMARRNKKKIIFAFGPAIRYEIRMIYSEVKLVIPQLPGPCSDRVFASTLQWG